MADQPPSILNHQAHVRRRGPESMTVQHISLGTLASLMLEICDECHYIRTRCEHQKMEWKHRPECTGQSDLVPDEPCSGCLLECTFCGIDGT